jgi:nitrite reductase/ring-hydroxylating ferredoxin subunit
MKHGVTLILIPLLILLVFSCKREQHPVPTVHVDMYISLNIPSSQPLNSPGGAIYHEGGYKGLIIYRRTLTNSSEDFIAYDRACPNDWEKECGRISISKDMMYGICGCDSGQYLLYDGSAVGGNESVPLKFYRVRYLGNSLHVFN